MIIYPDKITEINIAYIGGGSRGWAWKLMSDLADEPELGGNVRLYDIDFPAAMNNEIIGNRFSALEETKGRWNYTAVRSLEEALRGADFVIISILPGTFKEMKSDVHEPERYGIYQPVGDSTGPGGMIRALRTIPMMAGFAQNIRRFSPKAWVINYTNPMSLCVKALYHAFPEIKAFGCCHEVFGTQKLLAFIAEKALGAEAVTRSDIHVNVIGINHFTWFSEASYQGNDLFPVWRDFVYKYASEGIEEEGKPWDASVFDCAHKVKFDLFRRFGYIAAAGDRHLAEFMPGKDYLKDPETVRAWKFNLTPVSWREKDLEDRLALSRQLVSGEKPVRIEKSGEEGILLIKALLGFNRVISNVNIPNHGQIPNLPLGTIVETNAVFSRDSIRAVMAGDIPEKLLQLIKTHVENHTYILQAAFEHRKEPVIRAFGNDPLVKAACLSEKQINSLIDTMLRNTRDYLAEEWNITE